MVGNPLHRERKLPTILYIEDNPENRMLARAVLEAEGYTIVEAEDGLSGVEAAIREQPALILLDINLPGVDGYEVAAVIKSFPNLAMTPVIAVTAYAMEGDRQRTLVAGCDGYIQKPIDVDNFPRQVAEFLQGKRERVEPGEEGAYLRELNQRLVYRLLNQVEELKRLNQHFMRRAEQLEELHGAVQDITSELGVTTLLEQLLPGIGRALGTTSLEVELSDPADVRVKVEGETTDRPQRVLAGMPMESGDEWAEVEWMLPLVVRGRTLGQMVARHAVPPGAKAEEEQLLKIVANQVAIAVENARLYEETQRRLRHTETFLTVSQAVGSTLEVTEVLRRTTRELVRTLAADVGSAWHVSPAQDQLFPIAGYHVPKDLDTSSLSPPVLVGHPLVEEATRLQGPIHSSDSQTDPRFDYPVLRLLPHKSVLVSPMSLKGEIIGVFVIAWTKESHALSTEELRLVDGIVRQAVVAIENSRLYEDVKRQMAELKQAQAQLIQSTKLAAIGELVANVAHELNNPLTSVLGFATYLAERMSPGEPMREELNLIIEESGRARDIVRDLLDFSRRREFTPEPADINVVLEQTIAMVRRQGAPDNISLYEVYADALPTINVDAARMKQVFLNIINNALHAMPDGGSLTVRSSTADGFVQVEFIDTGRGIAPEHVDKIFDPFFTTKPDASGTGLGLSVSLGIIQSHGGTIEVRSEIGKGSTFAIKLPVKPSARPTAKLDPANTASA